MYGIIWYYNKEKGKIRLQKLVDDYAKNNIRIDKIFSYPDKIVFQNGDIWKLLKIGDSSRGHGCNISLVERNISIEDFNTFVRPVTKFCPYQAYDFYGEGELEGEFGTWNINF